MDNRVYWIWLQNAFGAGSPKPVQLVRRIGDFAQRNTLTFATITLKNVRPEEFRTHG